MEESIATQLTGLTTQQQLYVQWVIMIVAAIGKLYGAAVNGGGLKKIFVRVWLGSSVDKVIAQDYPEIATCKHTTE